MQQVQANGNGSFVQFCVQHEGREAVRRAASSTETCLYRVHIYILQN